MIGSRRIGDTPSLFMRFPVEPGGKRRSQDRCRHAATMHGEQEVPPQSVSLSTPFCVLSVHVAAGARSGGLIAISTGGGGGVVVPLSLLQAPVAASESTNAKAKARMGTSKIRESLLYSE